MIPIKAITLLCIEYQEPLLDEDKNLTLKNQIRMDWIKQNISENDIEGFIKKILATVKSEYKVMPSIATFEEILLKSATKTNEQVEIEALRAYRWINKNLNAYRSVFFENIVLQLVIEDMGGWVAFCSRQASEDVWTRKRFIELYKMHSREKIKSQPRTLPGINTDNRIIFFGDKEKCLCLIEQQKNEQKNIIEMQENIVKNIIKREV